MSRLTNEDIRNKAITILRDLSVGNNDLSAEDVSLISGFVLLERVNNEELVRYEDLEEQGRLIDWRKTSEEKPGSTRHVIVADGAIISHYGYYLKPKDKWFTDWTCEKEIDAPMFWMDMPDPPEESLHGDCCAKMDEVEK